MSKSFECPYCSRPTTITSPNLFSTWEKIKIENSIYGDIGLGIYAITCPSDNCKGLYLRVNLTKAKGVFATEGIRYQSDDIIQTWQLMPDHESKILPSYIPQPIQEDYYEACKISDVSPKASATLARRCLQGMIRDFWNIKKNSLKDEIDSIQENIDPAIWSSIEAIRKIGNIGAHMEKDINTIVEIEPEEAKLLIGLIEQLIEDWYVDRKNRQDRSVKLSSLVSKKFDN